MMEADTGFLVIKSLNNDVGTKQVRQFLLSTLKNCSPQTVDNLLKKTPITLKGSLSERQGEEIAKKLNALGAETVFVKKGRHYQKLSSKDVDFTQNRKLHGQEKADEQIESAPPLKAQNPLKIQGQEDTTDSTRPYIEEPTNKDVNIDNGPKEFSIDQRPLRYRLADRIAEVNKELWIIFSMVAIAGLMNYLVTSEYMILGLYSFPTILSAYFYGRRHAVMTAVLTIILIGIMIQYNGFIFHNDNHFKLVKGQWYHVMAWGSVLICTAYTMGTLYERHIEKVKELRKTYQGLIVILRHFISKDQYTENHCYRVSIYAAKIAAYLGLDDEAIEDIRSAALLHDIGKLKVSRELLYKAAKLSENEYKEIQKHVDNSAEILEPLRGPLGRIIPIILAHHDRFDGNGYRPNKGGSIPLGARILAVADVYDALTSDRPYRKAMAPMEAKEVIVKGSGKDFDPVVVKAFLKAFEMGEMEVPNFVV